MDLTSIAVVRRMSSSDIGKLNKDSLKTALNTLMTDNGNDSAASNDMYTQTLLRLEKKFDAMETSIVAKLRGEIDSQSQIIQLQTQNTTLRESLLQHQRYLESIESEKRSKNIMVMGVGESTDISHNGHTAKNDLDKCNLILTSIGCNASIEAVTRIGQQPDNTNRKRPIKVQLASADVRSDILNKAKNLKDLGEPLSNIFIKKDQHPMVRRELNRLHTVAKTEKGKAENQGKTVEFDNARRCVIVNGEIVDQFKPRFF